MGKTPATGAERRLEAGRAAQNQAKLYTPEARLHIMDKLSTQTELNTVLRRQRMHKLHILPQETTGFRDTYSEVTRSPF